MIKCSSSNDRGAALITVLSMLAILSALAIVVLDAANFGLRRTDNMVRMEQTRWYLLGAETFARSRLLLLNPTDAAARVDETEWQGRPFDFPLDDGLMRVELSDGDNCFNLNSLVTLDDSGERHMSALGLVQFSRLLDVVGVKAAHGGLAAALVDWLDSDAQPIRDGAEAVSTTHGRAYRAANALLGDVSELTYVRGFDAESVARLLPYVCVRPGAAPNSINPNTLRPEQAPLLVMALDDLPLETARRVIRERPRGGWESVEAFLVSSSLSGLELNDAGRAQFSIRTRYVLVSTRVERDRAREYSASLLEIGGNGRASVVRRVFGARLEEGRL